MGSRIRAVQPGISRTWTLVQQAFSQFLLIPSLIVLLFILLAALTFYLDSTGSVGLLANLRNYMQQAVFRSSSQTSSLLGTLAGSLITVTSITFSFLVLAVQGSASGMSNAVLSQFLNRNLNRIIFGYFIGLSFYTLIVLSTITPYYNPIYGGTFAILLTLVGLLLLPILFYSTIYQMHPASVVDAVHDHVIKARRQQLQVLDRTLRSPQLGAPVQCQVRSQQYGFLSRVDLKPMEDALHKRPAPTEVDIRVTIGEPVGHNQVIAEIRSTQPNGLDEIHSVVQRSLVVTRVRDYHQDPVVAIDEIRTIGWTTASTAKQNPSAALACVYSLVDLLYRLSDEDLATSESTTSAGAPTVPVVLRDGVLNNCLDALEAIAIVATRGTQYQTYSAVVRGLAHLYETLAEPQRDHVDGIIRQILIDLHRSQMETAETEQALAELADTLGRHGKPALAQTVRQTLERNRPSSSGNMKKSA